MDNNQIAIRRVYCNAVLALGADMVYPYLFAT